MKFKVFKYPVIISLFIISVVSCNEQHHKSEIVNAMQQYDHLIQKMDADSIALMFTPDGDLGDVAHGRTWIKRYLHGFANLKVVSQQSSSDSILIKGDTAIQKGTYSQVTIIAPEDTVKLKGDFVANRIWNKHTGWLLKSIIAKPQTE